MVETDVIVVCWIAEVCESDNGALVDALLLATEESARFGFCPGKVSFGKATPSMAQSSINATNR